MFYLTSPSLHAIPSVQHAFFTRNIPESTHVYIMKEDFIAATKDTVLNNRSCAMQHLHCPAEELSLLHQIHSNHVITVTSPLPSDPAIKADAQVTHLPGITLGILTADCAPVLCVDPSARVIGAIHAGWKGARADIIAHTIDAMCALGATAEHIVATIGPCIQSYSYEVGPEFRDNFLQEGLENARFFASSSDQEEHFMFDLPAYVLHKLHRSGVTQSTNLGKDTFSNEAEFFSYRRCTKRGETYKTNLLSVIRLERV